MESGDLTMLAIMSAERNSVFPDVPTCQEQGYDCVWGTWRGIALPLDVDKEIVETLGKACAAAAEDPDFIEFMKNAGQTISYLNAEDFAESMKMYITNPDWFAREFPNRKRLIDSILRSF